MLIYIHILSYLLNKQNDNDKIQELEERSTYTIVQ